jgi:hypothetical protein
LTASFPNLIYVVAFDRARVEQALTEDGTAGRSYLEKIIQVVVDLPAPSERILVQEIGAAIAATLRDVGRDVRFSGDLWPDVFFEVVRPLLRNMRDVNRYCMSARGTLRIVDGHVEAVDVLALEAVRVFMPGFFSAIVSNVSLLTKTAPSYGAGTSSPTVGDGMRAILDAAERTDVARAVIQRLFPAAQRFMGGSSYGSEWSAIWLKERRVANEEILRLYIEGVQGDALSAFLLAERAETLLTDAGRLDAFLSALSDDVLTGVVQQLEASRGTSTAAGGASLAGSL